MPIRGLREVFALCYVLLGLVLVEFNHIFQVYIPDIRVVDRFLQYHWSNFWKYGKMKLIKNMH